jgi:hypothetical protein
MRMSSHSHGWSRIAQPPHQIGTQKGATHTKHNDQQDPKRFGEMDFRDPTLDRNIDDWCHWYSVQPTSTSALRLRVRYQTRFTLAAVVEAPQAYEAEQQLASLENSV